MGPGANQPVIALPEEPVLDIHEIQGNSLAGFNKDYQTFLFLQIKDADGFRDWLRLSIPSVSTLDQVHQFNRLFRTMVAQLKNDPEHIAACWLNIAFSASGIRKIVEQSAEEQLQDPAFQGGLFQDSSNLGDPPDRTVWKFGASADTEADVMLIVAGDRRNDVLSRVKSLRREIQQVRSARGRKALVILWTQDGATLPGALRGHEHFGFKDGISQPAVRGRVSDRPDDFLTPRAFPPGDERSLRFARPGRRLIWPGQFVLGYPRQDDAEDVNALDPKDFPEIEPAWARNGSYVVFRRLRQHYRRFWEFMAEMAREVAQTPEFVGLDAKRLAALLVGRWPSGAPVVLSPGMDDPVLAEDKDRVNDFLFREPDEAGIRCPLSAHIRKANTRDDPVEGSGPRQMLTRLVLRRGIPYGAVDDEDKGLLFVCYQRSITAQFQFLLQQWANAKDLPQPNSGQDPIIGQKSPERVRTLNLKSPQAGNPGGKIQKIVIPSDFVEPTGGGYFFAPSISSMLDWVRTDKPTT